jgi:hypothetical protein
VDAEKVKLTLAMAKRRKVYESIEAVIVGSTCTT